MKVVFVTYDSQNDVGGVSSWLRRLLPGLQAAGIEVEAHVLAFGGRAGTNCSWFEKRGVPFQWIPWEWKTGKAVRRCLNMLEKSNPDVYVPNCILPAYYAAAHVRRAGVQTIGVLHSDEPFYWGIVEEFCDNQSPFCLSAVVAVSQFLQEMAQGVNKERSVVTLRIGCGVPISREVAKAAGGVFRLVYVGRLVEEQKRISELTDAFCSVVKQNPGMEAWIVGDGDARPNVERIIQASGVDSQRVKLLGRVDVSAIYPVLRECHAFVLLSDYEGLPVSLLEAMSAGVVPVCLDMRSGIREAIQPGFNGLLVKDRKEDFFSAIRQLQKDPRLWSKLSANALETVKEHFSEEKCIASWVELLRSFKERDRANPVKSPVFLRLPRRNPKFGQYDQRLSWVFLRAWSRLRKKAAVW